MMLIIIGGKVVIVTRIATCSGKGPVCGAGVEGVVLGDGRRVDGWNSSSIIA